MYYPTVTSENVCWGIRNVKSLIKIFYNMRCFVMFVTAVCVLFLLKLKWPKNKSLYLTSLVYHLDIFGSSSKVFGNLLSSSENNQKPRHQYVCTIRTYEDMKFMFPWQEQYLTRKIFVLPLEHSPRLRVISSISYHF